MRKIIGIVGSGNGRAYMYEKREAQRVVKTLEQRHDEIKWQLMVAARDNDFARVERLSQWLQEIQQQLSKEWKKI